MYTPRTYHEQFYRKVREEMVTFMRYDTKHPPVVENGKIRIHHPYYEEDLEMDYDLVVLSVPIVANKDSKETDIDDRSRSTIRPDLTFKQRRRTS